MTAQTFETELKKFDRYVQHAQNIERLLSEFIAILSVNTRISTIAPHLYPVVTNKT